MLTDGRGDYDRGLIDLSKVNFEEGILWDEIRCCILTNFNSFRDHYKYKFVL